ncbi:MAG: hypothetical protein ACI90V_010638 [Bacillariaceae sp.]|jgi:hypothetical protein
MKEGKGIAKTMDRTAKCHGCNNEFPKETPSVCNGCQFMKYHNRECQINDWSSHKSFCKNIQENARESKKEARRMQESN